MSTQRIFIAVNIHTVNKENGKEKSSSKREKIPRLKLDFENTPDKLKEEYLDVYEWYTFRDFKNY